MREDLGYGISEIGRASMRTQHIVLDTMNSRDFLFLIVDWIRKKEALSIFVLYDKMDDRF